MKTPESPQTSPRIEYDVAARKLTVRDAYEFPQAAYELADEIEILDMSHNYLVELPDDMVRFVRMRVGFFSGNPLGKVPEILARCAQLQLVGLKSCGIRDMAPGSLPRSIKGIILTDNQLAELPPTLGKEYPELQKLMLTGNQLTELPASLRGHTRLELLRVAVNALKESPQWLAELAQLAWYSDAGNPLHGHDQIPVPNYYGPDKIALGELLGESAKNQVYRGTLGGEAVAVKLFGHGVTTDGLPEDDIQASLRVGAHKGLIGARGIYQDGEQMGLVMPLIPASCRTLAQPPDFSTFTRDVYSFDVAPTTTQAMATTRDIAEALRHLHAQGVMHGDVYAHNILANDAGSALLGDFGASSLYDPVDIAQAWRQQLEVLGFGRLVAELANRSTGDVSRLHTIAGQCMDPDATRRPSFAQLCEELA